MFDSRVGEAPSSKIGMGSDESRVARQDKYSAYKMDNKGARAGYGNLIKESQKFKNIQPANSLERLSIDRDYPNRHDEHP